MYYHMRWTKIGTVYVGRKFRTKLKNVPRGMVFVYILDGMKIAGIAGSRRARDLPKSQPVCISAHVGYSPRKVA